MNRRIARTFWPATTVVLICWPALLGAGCSSHGDSSSRRSAAATRVKEVAGVDLFPLPRPLVGACHRFAQRASEPLLCPSALPRPSRALNHAAYIPHGFAVFPIRGRYGLSGLSFSYSAEAGSPHLNQPERFIHFDIQTRNGELPLPPEVRPARLGGLDGLFSPATSHTYASEPYFANHVRFFWRDGTTRYAATLHDFGPRTQAVLAAIVRDLEPAQRIRGAPRREADGVETLRVSRGPISLARGEAGVWVATLGRGGSRLFETGRDGRTSQGPIEVSHFLAPVAVAAQGSEVWVAQAGVRQPDLLRLERGDEEFTPAFTAGMTLVDLALTEDDVWAVDLGSGDLEAPGGAGTLERVDRATGRPIARVRVGRAPAAVAVGEGSVWVANSIDGTLSRVDPVANKVTTTIGVGRSPVDVVVGDGAVWVANADDNTIDRIDPETSEITETIGVGQGPRAVAFGEGSIWVANYLDDTVSRIDPESQEASETIAVGAGPTAIAIGHGSVWVANRLDQTLSRIRP